MAAVTSPAHTDLAWSRSSYCGNGACVEVAYTDNGQYVVRDGKHPDGGTLTFSKAGWAYLMGEFKAGKFNA